jgi:hypothetical protein
MGLPNQGKEAQMKYAVCTAAGCYSGNETTVHSVHKTLRQAAARLNERRTIVEFDDGATWCREGYKFPLPAPSATRGGGGR